MPENIGENVLCIRADNMGDVIMSSPAMRALKHSFGCRITLLTSLAGAIIAPHLDCVDEVITASLPWVKSDGMDDRALTALAEELRTHAFDSVVIFTVYSQSALPAAMLAFMAGIPVRVAYARENPYGLLTHWTPDLEPYQRILHQVERDLDLVRSLGAGIGDDRLRLQTTDHHGAGLAVKLGEAGVGGRPFMMLHPGVSEAKREYPVEKWIEVGKLLRHQFAMPLLVTGSASESGLAAEIAGEIGSMAIAAAGMFGVGEFIALVDKAVGVVSVNTGTIHIAAAMQTPAVVLYAQTNPQHTPWKSPHELLPFSVPGHLRSKNPIIQEVAERLYRHEIPYPAPEQVLAAMKRLLSVRH